MGASPPGVPVNLAKRKLRAGQLVLGHAVFEFATPGIARILQAAGVEFALFDMEHAAFGIDTIRQLVSYARGTTVSPFVRVPTIRYEYIAAALDVGAQGIWLPLVESREQVERAVQATRYPPCGSRGIAYGIAHDDFTGGDLQETMRRANEEILLTAMIESKRGLENLEEIASHPELDMVWIGHHDLAVSLGVPGDIDHPLLLEAFDRLIQVARRHGKFAGRGVTNVASAVEWVGRGLNAITYSRDIVVFQTTLARHLRQVRDAVGRDGEALSGG
ncbi:MAG TPA: aldolase/citrate lyase family protein [Candidatus Dormibacteraeota bacterium]|nr:aldolase/citrate lyase family protein [Candidatus Dormibacteraeota bacterium]